MNVFRTPKERFEAWIDFPFESRYIEIEDSEAGSLRMHYIDEGPDEGEPSEAKEEAPVMLMVHGMPTSCYLYRHIIPLLVAKGYRCVAADSIGFGKSDKVAKDAWYSVDKHQQNLEKFIKALDLQGITVLVQDWGGPLGLRGPVDMPERYDRLCILNTWLHHSDYTYNPIMWGWNSLWHPYDLPYAKGERNTNPSFLSRIGAWLVKNALRFMVGDHPVATAVYSSTLGGRAKGNENHALYLAYDAPFPSFESKAGCRRFPLSLPYYNPTGGNAEVQERCYNALKKWAKPAHFIWGDQDPNFNPKKMQEWADVVPGSTTHLIIGGGHFTQETHAQEIVDVLLERMAEE